MGQLSEDQIASELKTIRGWARAGNNIMKTYDFGDFVHAMGFVSSVALLAEKANHHPDIDVRWSKVIISLSTHSAGGLTEKDFTLARQIENL